MVLDSLGRSWKILDSLGQYWTVFDSLVRSWMVLDGLGRSWMVLDNLGQLRTVMSWMVFNSLGLSNLREFLRVFDSLISTPMFSLYGTDIFVLDYYFSIRTLCTMLEFGNFPHVQTMA